MKPFWAILISLFCLSVSAQEKVTGSMTVERDSLQIGEQTTLEVQVSYPATLSEQPQWPNVGKTLGQSVEILNYSKIDTIADPDGDDLVMIQTQKFTVTVFDTGHVVIEPFVFLVGADSISTNPLLLSIYAPSVDLLGDIKPIRPALEVDYSLTHWLKSNWPWLLLGIVLGICIFLLIKYLRRKPKVIKAEPEPIKEIIPPHVMALRKLQELQAEGLWQKGLVKQYHVRLTNILREYMEERYNILALEETTHEILDELKGRHIESSLIGRARKVLTLADMVKFAKAKPLPADNESSFTSVKEFIELSKLEMELEVE